MKKKSVFQVLGLGIALFLALIIGFVIGYYSQSKTTAQASSTNTMQKAPSTHDLLALVNAERARNGIAPLKEDARLDASAQMKANDEVAYNYFGHVSPANSPFAGRQGYEYINLTGISCITDSENLVDNVNPTTRKEYDNTSTGAVNAWINSKPHHTAMINPKYNITGFGINGTQVVEHFCQSN